MPLFRLYYKVRSMASHSDHAVFTNKYMVMEQVLRDPNLTKMSQASTLFHYRKITFTNNYSIKLIDFKFSL